MKAEVKKLNVKSVIGETNIKRHENEIAAFKAEIDELKKISSNHSNIAVPSVAGQGLQQINGDQLFDELEDRQWRACNVVIVIYRNLYYIHR